MPVDSAAFLPTRSVTCDTFDVEGGTGSWGAQAHHPMLSGFYALDNASIAVPATISVSSARAVRESSQGFTEGDHAGWPPATVAAHARVLKKVAAESP